MADFGATDPLADDFLRMAKTVKEMFIPGGMALGNATGDSLWCNWLRGHSAANWSMRTTRLSSTAPRRRAPSRTARSSTQPSSRVRCRGSIQTSDTNNGISLSTAAKNSQDQSLKDIAADIRHAPFPIGPVGVPAESHLFFSQMVMKYTKYPQAAKEFLRFMMEDEQYRPWLTAAVGYVSPRSITKLKFRSGRQTPGTWPTATPSGTCGP